MTRAQGTPSAKRATSICSGQTPRGRHRTKADMPRAQCAKAHHAQRAVHRGSSLRGVCSPRAAPKHTSSVCTQPRMTRGACARAVCSCRCGAGLVALPFCFFSCGVGLAFVTLAVVGLACRFSFSLLLHCRQLSRDCRTYEVRAVKVQLKDSEPSKGLSCALLSAHAPCASTGLIVRALVCVCVCVFVCASCRSWRSRL